MKAPFLTAGVLINMVISILILTGVLDVIINSLLSCHLCVHVCSLLVHADVSVCVLCVCAYRCVCRYTCRAAIFFETEFSLNMARALNSKLKRSACSIPTHLALVPGFPFFTDFHVSWWALHQLSHPPCPCFHVMLVGKQQS